MSRDLVLPGGLVIPARLLHWKAVRASGPGGQNVNKVATKVELHFDLDRWGVSAALGARVRKCAGRSLDAEGRIVVVSQLTRQRERNLEDARERLAQLVARAVPEPKRRRATRPSKRSKAERVETKRRRSQVKRGRRSVGEGD